MYCDSKGIMTHANRSIAKILALLTALAVAVVVAAPAGAIVPPRDCGILKIGSKRYNIKADQLRCPTAKRYAEAYLRRKAKPSGYRCTRGASGSKLVFRCVAARYNPDRTFFAIRK